MKVALKDVQQQDRKLRQTLELFKKKRKGDSVYVIQKQQCDMESVLTEHEPSDPLATFSGRSKGKPSKLWEKGR